MWALRQRLLLIAGWAIAAVATGLVSAGAVAVAGGQVNDRPLRPMSAADVAALQVTIEDDCVTNGPLASGGPRSDGRCPDLQAANGQSEPGDSDAQPAEREFPEPTLARGPEVDRPYPEGTVIPDVLERDAAPVVVDVRGGRVSVGSDDGMVVFHSATPKPGYVTDLVFDGDAHLTVTFWNGSSLSSVVASIGRDGTLSVTYADSR